MRTVFALTSGRSGTKFLCDLFRRNARGCEARHEPYFDRGNASMFGRPIYDHAIGNITAVRNVVQRKADAIHRKRGGAYIETSHAFLKSYYDIACDYFPQMKLIHLIRDPLKVAKSEMNREATIHRLRLPLRYYRGDDGEKYFRWSLTGNERIFATSRLESPTRLQWYLLQWIEIENRAMWFLDQFDKHADCFTLESPIELNAPERLTEMFDFLGLEHQPQLVLGIARNRNPGKPTTVSEEDREQLRQVVEWVSPEYLAVFRKPPYTRFAWSNDLQEASAQRCSHSLVHP